MKIKKPLITRIVNLLIAITLLFAERGYSDGDSSKLRPALQFSKMGREAIKGTFEPGDDTGLSENIEVLEAKRKEQEKIERMLVAIRSLKPYGSVKMDILEFLTDVVALLDNLVNDKSLSIKQLSWHHDKIKSLSRNFRKMVEQCIEASKRGELSIVDVKKYSDRIVKITNTLKKENKVIISMLKKQKRKDTVLLYGRLLEKSFTLVLGILRSRIKIFSGMSSNESQRLDKIIHETLSEEIVNRSFLRVEPFQLPSLVVKGDRLSLISALANILKNAMFFAKEKQGDKAEVVLRVSKENNFARIDVIDNGHGIQQDLLEIDPVMQRPKLFNLNVSQREGGTGIGTTEAWYAIKDAGGTIDVVSEVGKGTAFIVRLPIAKNTQPKPISNLDIIKASRDYL